MIFHLFQVLQLFLHGFDKGEIYWIISNFVIGGIFKEAQNIKCHSHLIEITLDGRELSYFEGV